MWPDQQDPWVRDWGVRVRSTSRGFKIDRNTRIHGLDYVHHKLLRVCVFLRAGDTGPGVRATIILHRDVFLLEEYMDFHQNKNAVV